MLKVSAYIFITAIVVIQQILIRVVITVLSKNDDKADSAESSIEYDKDVAVEEAKILYEENDELKREIERLKADLNRARANQISTDGEKWRKFMHGVW